VMERCGCTVLPAASVVEEVAGGRLRCFALSTPPVTREVAIAWPQNRAMPEGVWEVTRAIRDLAATLVDDGSWPGTTLLAPQAPVGAPAPPEA